MEAMNEQKLNELKDNPEFREKLSQAKDLDQAVEILSQYGVEIEKEELEKAAAMVPAGEGELNEDALDNVSGGCMIPWWLLIVISSSLILHRRR